MAASTAVITNKCPACGRVSLPACDVLVTVRGDRMVAQQVCPSCTDVLTTTLDMTRAKQLVAAGAVNYTDPSKRGKARMWLDTMRQLPNFIDELASLDAAQRFAETTT